MGTGAFSFTQTDRDVEIEVVDDTAGYLGLTPLKGDYAEVDESSGEIGMEFDSLNANSVTLFDEVVEVQNNGSEDIYLTIADVTNNGYWTTNFVPYATGAASGERQSLWTKDGKTGPFNDRLNNRTDVDDLDDLVATGSVGIKIPVGQTAKLGFAFASNEDGETKSTGITLQAATDTNDMDVDDTIDDGFAENT